MDATVYFFTSLGILNFILALLSFLLGLLFCKMFCGNCKKSKVKESQSTTSCKSDQKKSADLQTQLDQSAKDHKKLEANLSGVNAELSKVKENLSTAEGALSNAKAEVSTLKLDLEKAKSATTSITTPTAGVVAGAAAKTSTLEPVKAEAPTDTATDMRAKNKNFFGADLASGKLREDAKLGLLYTQEVEKDQQDDLTHIKGVASVLNDKLHKFGVYKYRQIALWTPQICEDFSEEIAFKGRVQRDNWVDQCKQFHQEKYGEQI